MRNNKLLLILSDIRERDINMIMPILYYLENAGYIINITNSLDYNEINKGYDAVLYTNITGEKITLRNAYYVNKTNIPIISLIAEGNIVEKKLKILFGVMTNIKRNLNVTYYFYGQKDINN